MIRAGRDLTGEIEQATCDGNGECFRLEAALQAPQDEPPMALVRYGIQHFTPTEPICRVMPDGYWTPWHAAKAAVEVAEAALQDAQREIAAAMKVLDPAMPSSGLVDACKQVKQVAISEADNSEKLESRLAQVEAEREELYRRATAESDLVNELQADVDRLHRERETLTQLVKKWVPQLRAFAGHPGSAFKMQQCANEFSTALALTSPQSTEVSPGLHRSNTSRSIFTPQRKAE